MLGIAAGDLMQTLPGFLGGGGGGGGRRGGELRSWKELGLDEFQQLQASVWNDLAWKQSPRSIHLGIHLQHCLLFLAWEGVAGTSHLQTSAADDS